MNREKTLKQVFEIMEQSFPESEYRPYVESKKIIEDKRYKIITENDDSGNVLGFISFWEFENLNFVEHLAINSILRGNGMGSRIARRYLGSTKNIPTVLEVEIPTDELKIRRIKFYERLGFKLNLYFYNQPSLAKGQPRVPMYIMSYPNSLSLSEFIDVRDILYRNIYN